MNRVHDTSSASADARVETPPDVTSEPLINRDSKLPNKDSNKAKPKRFTKPNPNTRRGGAAYTKTPTISSLSIVPRRSVFPIFTSNAGCDYLTQLVYLVMSSKDHRLAQTLSVHQLAYVTTLAFLNRVVQCSIHYGTAFSASAGYLKQVTEAIQLPNVLAKYIESVGSFDLLSGVTVVPLLVPPHHLANTRLMICPSNILRHAGRQVPPDEWSLDINWITEYNAATTRAGKSGMNFRSVNNTTLVGSSEMLVSYKRVDDMLIPKAPQLMSSAEAQLGAAYRFRDYTQKDQWIGENCELLFDAFTAIPFEPRVLITDICVAAFQGGYVSRA